MRIWSWFIGLNKWSVFNRFQKNSVIILKSTKKSFPRERCSKTYQIPWTFSAWIRNCNRWTQRAFLILAINKCKCSQWQMECIFSLYRDISLAFISTFCQTSCFDTKPQYSSYEASVWSKYAETQSQGPSSLMFLFQSKVCKHSRWSDYLQGVSVHPPCFISFPAPKNVLITGSVQWLQLS